MLSKKMMYLLINYPAVVGLSKMVKYSIVYDLFIKSPNVEIVEN